MNKSRITFVILVTLLGLSLFVGAAMVSEAGRAAPNDISFSGQSSWAQGLACSGTTMSGQPSYTPTTGGLTADNYPAVVGGGQNIDNSMVATGHCYVANQVQTLCFDVHNGSSDSEWIDQVQLTFPTLVGAWNISCSTQDPTDSIGYPVALSCTIPSANVVRYTDNDSDGYGEIAPNQNWGFCVNAAIPPGYNGPRMVNWSLSGDQSGSTPHEVNGTISMEECTPLMLKPTTLNVEGCNGVESQYVFELWNNTGSYGNFTLVYDVPSGNAEFTGPALIAIGAGSVVSFTTQLTPNFCAEGGQTVSAVLQALGNSEADYSTINFTVTDISGWRSMASSPVKSMDQAVVWAVGDGGLWSIGGYGASGATQRYDPDANTWTLHTAEISPTITYPGDGCYGLDEDGHEVVVLFPDTTNSVNVLHRYDITADHWETLPIPVGFPGARWQQDITSLYNVNGVNRCYISGGATFAGGGNIKNFWEYRPATNVTVFLGNFTYHPNGFDFHASWYVPWIGSEGAICVGGGIDSGGNVSADTQCYDLATNTLHAPNADLGPLPEPWWGMADGWTVVDGKYQIWIAQGVAQGGGLLPASAYADATTGGFLPGPKLPVGLYRLEGDAMWGSSFFIEQGAAGWFSVTANNFLLRRCPTCYKNLLPLVIR